MVAAPQMGDRLSDLQFCILVAIPLVGILTNTALFIHLSGTMNIGFARLESKMEAGFERLDARFDMLMGKSVEIDNHVEW
jgi:hypothetical protein